MLDSSSPSGDVLRVIGRICIRVTRCERSGKNHRIAVCDPYHVVSEHQVDHSELLVVGFRPRRLGRLLIAIEVVEIVGVLCSMLKARSVC